MADRVGQQLGNYQLLRLLGEGGFAEVYLGEHIHLGSQAAIKVLQSQLSSEDIDRFRTEARTIVRLVHPNIVRVLEFGIEGKTPFLVMDFAPNGTLRQRHPKGTGLPLETVVSYVKQVADALQYAHDEKFIHRDIKPENMLVGRRGEILLSDFGIAIVAQSSRYQSAQDMAGTIAYMAPEQIQAHPRPASDQYSLGIVVYEWLTGERPFQGSFSEIAIKHTVVPPLPIRGKVPSISRDVEQVVMTALAKDPHERFASVQAFARALEQTSQPDTPTFIKPIVSPDSPVSPVRSASPQPTNPAPSLNLPATTPVMHTPPPALARETIVSIPQLPATQYVVPPQRSLPQTKYAGSQQPRGTEVYTYRGHTHEINALAWSPGGKYLISVSDDRTTQIWNAMTGEKVTELQEASVIKSVAWSPGSGYVVLGGDDGAVKVWNVKAGKEVWRYVRHSQMVSALSWSPDGKYIASGSPDQIIYVWDALTGNRVLTYGGHKSCAVNAVQWSPDGKYIASADSDRTVQVWAPFTKNHFAMFTSHLGAVVVVCWSPDRKKIASSGDDTTVQIWDAFTTRSIYVCRGHVGKVQTMDWSPNGKYIASGGEDRTVQVWSAHSGNFIYTYRGHSDQVKSLAWSPDGKYIASASGNVVHVWVAP